MFSIGLFIDLDRLERASADKKYSLDLEPGFDEDKT